MTLTVVSPALSDGRIVSSSAIRGAIAAGRMKEAVEMLGHPHQIAGTVAAGAGRGRHLGFPTANLTGIVTLLPADGVYAGVARLNRQAVPAAVHIGSNPTFGEPQRKVEAHLVGFEGDLYGQPLAIDLIDRVRETRTFDSGDALQAQLRRDVARAVELAASHPGDQNDAAD
jgi:riboflavin kinase/FMN adenylyltransferase